MSRASARPDAWLVGAAGLLLGLIVGAVVGATMLGGEGASRESGPGVAAARAGTSDDAPGSALEAVPPATPVGATEASGESLEDEAARVARRAAIEARSRVADATTSGFTGRVTGSVVGPDGAPVPGADVVCRNSPPRQDYNLVRGRSTSRLGRRFDRDSSIEDPLVEWAEERLRERALTRSSRTGGDGRFTLEGVREGVLRLEAHAEGFEFETLPCRSGDDVVIRGTRVHEHTFRLLRADGTEPESAVLYVEGAGSAGNNRQFVSWAPASPGLRIQAEQFEVTAAAGEVRRARAGVLGEWMSDSTPFDLAIDGVGPHELTLDPQQLLVVRIVDPTRAGDPRSVDLKIAPGLVDDTFDWNSSGTAELDNGYSGPQLASGLAPGTYTLGGFMGSWSAPVVTEAIEVGAGRTEVEFVLPGRDAEGVLIVRCFRTGGEPVTGVSFSCVLYLAGSSGGGGSISADAGETPGEYWIQWERVLRGRPWERGYRVELTARSPGLGSAVAIIEELSGDAEVTFEDPAALSVRLLGPSPTRFQAQLLTLAGATEERATKSSAWGRVCGEPVRFGGEGTALIRPLQPGPYELVLMEASLTGERTWFGDLPPLTSQLVSVGSGENACTLQAPPLHDLTVITPSHESGAEFILTRTDGPIAPTFWHAGVGRDGRLAFTGLPPGAYELCCASREAEVMRFGVPAGTLTFTPREPDTLLVGRINAGTPEAAAGLREGDVIVAVDGERPGTPPALRALYLRSVERAVTLTVQRGDVEVELTLGPTPGTGADGSPTIYLYPFVSR